MKTTNKELDTSKDKPLHNIDTYLFGMYDIETADGPERAVVYYCELNLLVNHYTEMLEQVREWKDKRALEFVECQLCYWTDLRRKFERRH